MKVIDLVTKSRSYRRFDQSVQIPEQELKECIEAARRAPSGANLQPLRFHLTTEKPEADNLFPLLKWAGYLSDWDGPEEGERPTAYVTVLRDIEVKDVASKTDAGIAMQTIMLSAVEKGYGGCIFASINRKEWARLIGVDDRYEILFVMALGSPVEEVKLEDAADKDDIKYYRDENQVHHVPKRRVSDLLV
ncbi:MAG TPA: nitroreductase family protein [Clostridia bacterium]|nr:nitroreductase family protein [Clostridia bacterium]